MWWNCVEVMNILINSALIALPLLVVSKVQISQRRKSCVGLMFAFRITYVLLEMAILEQC